MSNDIRLWIEALRNSNERQIKCQLTDTYGGYCAIGIFGKHVLGMSDSDLIRSKEECYDRVNAILTSGPYIVNDVYRMNDTFDITFDEIADKLERAYES